MTTVARLRDREETPIARGIFIEILRLGTVCHTKRVLAMSRRRELALLLMNDEDDIDEAKRFTGPLDEGSWPGRLKARVVQPGPVPRVHGYDVEGDLALHYSFSDYAFLCITGNLPTTAVSSGFQVALQFLAPVVVSEAAVHAGVLARLCAASEAGVISATCIGLAEQARLLVSEHETLIDWLDRPAGEFPPTFRDDDVAVSDYVGRLRQALASAQLSVPALDASPTRTASLIAVLHACGLGKRQIEAAVVLARYPAAVSEAFAETPLNFREYPINLPAFEYRARTKQDV